MGCCCSHSSPLEKSLLCIEMSFASSGIFFSHRVRFCRFEARYNYTDGGSKTSAFKLSTFCELAESLPDKIQRELSGSKKNCGRTPRVHAGNRWTAGKCAGNVAFQNVLTFKRGPHSKCTHVCVKKFWWSMAPAKRKLTDPHDDERVRAPHRHLTERYWQYLGSEMPTV